MANFNGIDLGLVEEISTAPAPNERQVNTYPGVNGLEVLDLGSRGGGTSLRGSLAGVDLYDLASIQNALRDVQQASVVGSLFDDVNSWPDVLLVQFRPTGPRIPLPFGGVAQRYEAEFLHIL